jgi:hypothetical protein
MSLRVAKSKHEKSEIRKQSKAKRKAKNFENEQNRIEKEIKYLCNKDSNGVILKENITHENYLKLKKLMNSLDIEILDQNDKSHSYRAYCKIFESFLFKNKSCGDHVCCQAITENGTRCKRPASNFSTIDFTGKQILPTIPEFIKKRFSAKKLQELKVIGFANTCCFYCWQHAAMFVAEKITWSTNISYYSTHPEDILSIFYDDVKPVKFIGTVTYNFKEIGELRDVDEIIKNIYKLKGTIEGAFSSTYWIIFAMVFMYDTLKPILLKFTDDINAIEDISITAANVLLEINEQ